MADVLSLDDNSSLQIVSYNCRGYNVTKRPYIQSLLPNTDILFLQEHWLSEDQLRLLGDIDSNFIYTGVSGFDCSDVLNGRPFGGCAILWRSDVLASVTPLYNSSRRVCAIRMCVDNLKFLFINVYMPYEGNDDTTSDFIDQLCFVEEIINNNLDCHVIVGGDFNVDFTRNRLHTLMLDNFCVDMHLRPAAKHSTYSIDYTYNFDMIRFNILDHFLLSDIIFNTSVVSARVLHDIDNTSDHEPIILQLCFQVRYLGFSNKIHTPRVSWAKASDSDLDNYRSSLTHELSTIVLPVEALLCSDLQCNNPNHFQAINIYAHNISDACTKAAEATIPATCNKQTSGRIPGWTEFIQPVRDKSLFWHKWGQTGCSSEPCAFLCLYR
jgi:exonuclease III